MSNRGQGGLPGRGSIGGVGEKARGKVEAEEGTGDVTVQYDTGKGRVEGGKYGNFCN